MTDGVPGDEDKDRQSRVIARLTLERDEAVDALRACRLELRRLRGPPAYTCPHCTETAVPFYDMATASPLCSRCHHPVKKTQGEGP